MQKQGGCFIKQCFGKCRITLNALDHCLFEISS